jgi:two-component system response regulator CpxR
MKPKRTILCVDEDERALSIRKIMLQTRGYRVIACSDPILAVEAMKDGGVDLILADLVLPKLNNGKIVDQLKMISPSTPAIVFSGAAGACSEDTLADVFLSKSDCSAAQLLDHVRVALVRKRGPKPAITSAYSAGRFPSAASSV